MKIGFFLDNRGVSKTDFSRPWEGNPGTGASEYMSVAVPYFITKLNELAEPVQIFAPVADKLPSNVVAHQCATIRDAAIKAKEVGIDYFVFRPRIHEEDNIIDILDEIELSSVGCAQLTPHPTHIRKLANSASFKAFSCVGREQYDYLMDSPIYKKLAYIDNGVHVDSCLIGPQVQKDPNLVAYMGALVPQKSFHVLAEAWPKVLEQVPEAKLSVIGSVKMYNQDSKLGPLGVAEEGYERSGIIPHLTNADGELNPSVTFHGQMGAEKYEILRRSSVGVANPTGATETCCVAAVEMAACGAAVVSGAYYALLDTVLHEKTGLLGRGVDELAANIVTLLKDPERARKMGDAGQKRAREKYDFSAVAPQWLALFRSLDNNKIPVPDGRLRNIFYHQKIIRLMNRQMRTVLGARSNWPSVHEAETTARRMVHKFR